MWLDHRNDYSTALVPQHQVQHKFLAPQLLVFAVPPLPHVPREQAITDSRLRTSSSSSHPSILSALLPSPSGIGLQQARNPVLATDLPLRTNPHSSLIFWIWIVHPMGAGAYANCLERNRVRNPTAFARTTYCRNFLRPPNAAVLNSFVWRAASRSATRTLKTSFRKLL